MKSILLYSFILLFLLACNTSKKQIEKQWISKYHISYEGTDAEFIGAPAFRGLVSFDRDSVVFNTLQYLDGSRKGVEKSNYSLHDNSLIIFNLKGNDSINISLNDSQLIFNVSPDVKEVFEVLPSYNQVKEEQKLLNYLTAHTYKIVTDTFEVFYEFQEDYTTFATTPHLKLVIDDRTYWRISQHGTELFLVLDNFNGTALHIKEITETEIKGVIYGKEDREVILERVLLENKFDLENLIGEWEEMIDRHKLAPPPPPPPPVGRKYYEQEILKISENELIRHRFLGSDTVHWQANRLGNKLFLPKYFQKIGAWTIKKLDEEHLFIERKWIYSSGLSLKWVRKEWGQKDFIEEIKFKKIKK